MSLVSDLGENEKGIIIFLSAYFLSQRVNFLLFEIMLYFDISHSLFNYV